MQWPMLSCCYHVKVTEVFEGRLYPLINLSALNHTVDYTSGAEAIIQIIHIKAHYFNPDYQDGGRESIWSL